MWYTFPSFQWHSAYIYSEDGGRTKRYYEAESTNGNLTSLNASNLLKQILFKNIIIINWIISLEVKWSSSFHISACGQYLTLYVQFWVPDDGRKNRLKHVQRLTEIKKLRNVASCWLCSANILATHGPMNVKSIYIYIYIYIGFPCKWNAKWFLFSRQFHTLFRISFFRTVDTVVVRTYRAVESNRSAPVLPTTQRRFTAFLPDGSLVTPFPELLEVADRWHMLSWTVLLRC